jgi:hypothetical protein
MTIQKTLLASLITLAALSGVTYADTLAGALTELQAIQSGMSKEEINQKIQRFIERAPEGTNIDGVLADLGLTYTGPMASSAHQQTLVMPHLDGTHQALVTPHLDAPVIDRSSHLDAPAIDRSSHLDSNVTLEQRDAAKAAAENLAAYRHNNPEGVPTHQTGPATHLDGTHQALVTPHLDAPAFDRSSHLDAPAVDRSSHLDSNVTQGQRDAAKTAAENLAAYRHNNPEGIPTHQTGPATHLDGTHQALVTPHLDAPVIDRSSHLDAPAFDRSSHLDAPAVDRSSHLDSNVTQEQRDAAKTAAENLAAYRHNNPEGTPTHQTDVTTQPEARQSSEQRLTAEKYASANTPHNGVDGKDGIDGKDGQSITGKTGAKGKDADMTQVNANGVALRGVRNEQAAQGAYIQQNSANVALNRARIASNSAAINQNSHDIAANRKDIDENTKDIKRVGAMAQAVSSLHYNRNESGYAVAAGEYDGEASIAGGMQFSTSQDSAVTMQVSWDGNATGAGVGFHSNF